MQNKARLQTMLKLKLYESSDELCQAILNWIVGNRKSLNRIESENLIKRIKTVPEKVVLALEKTKIDECFKELIIVNKELNALLIGIKSRYRTMGILENDNEECFTKFTKLLNDYHYC